MSKNALVCLHHVHFDVNTIFIFHLVWITFPETNSSSHLKMDGWNMIVSFFQGFVAVGFRESECFCSWLPEVTGVKTPTILIQKTVEIHRYISVMFQDIVLNHLFGPVSGSLCPHGFSVCFFLVS